MNRKSLQSVLSSVQAAHMLAGVDRGGGIYRKTGGTDRLRGGRIINVQKGRGHESD